MNFTGRGRPCTFGFATRGSRATRQLAMKKSAKAASAPPAIQPPQPRLLFRCGATGCSCAAGDVGCSLEIESVIGSAFLSEPIDQVRVDTVGVEGARHQIAGTHP